MQISKYICRICFFFVINIKKKKNTQYEAINTIIFTCIVINIIYSTNFNYNIYNDK